MVICIETHKTCDFPGGGVSGPPIHPLDPHIGGEQRSIVESQFVKTNTCLKGGHPSLRGRCCLSKWTIIVFQPSSHCQKVYYLFKMAQFGQDLVNFNASATVKITGTETVETYTVSCCCGKHPFLF